MASISRSALVPYSARRMYLLVDDIESYPLFLPWCRTTEVISRKNDEVKASIEIARGAVNRSFTTCNRLQKDKMIEMRLVEGPFRHLQGFWRFDSLSEDACKVMLDLEFEFAGKLLDMTIGPVFNQIANTLVDAFCQRAKEVYG